MAEGERPLVCPNGHEAPIGSSSRFCEQCGAELLTVCPVGHQTPVGGRFCRVCGAATTAESGQQVFSAPTGSMATTGMPGMQGGAGDPTIVVPAVAQTPLTPPQPTPAVGSRRNGAWFVAAIVGVVVVLGLAGGLVFVLAKPGHSTPSSAGSSSAQKSANTIQTLPSSATSSTSTTTTSTTLPTERLAAGALASLLGQSVADRSAINAATNDVSACGNLAQDEQTFDSAASSRQSLISQLSTLPNESALPNGMTQSLSAAWQASEEVDQDYASWAGDELSGGCTPNDTADPAYQAASGPNQQATNDKMTFASAWNLIAYTYSLPTYQWNQL